MQMATSGALPAGGGTVRQWLAHALPKIVLAPTLVASLIFVYGFIAWTGYLSLTPSRLLPNYDFVGLAQYIALFDNERWWVALKNLGIFGFLFVFLALAIGLTLAILLDQRIRIEGFLRSLYLYPMALSFIVTGAAWKWILNPSLGLEHLMRSWGFENFSFDWLVNPDRAIYTVVIAGVWQSAGFVMALCLAGLRGIDDSIIKAAQVDGASLFTIYWRIIIPSMRPVFFSAVIILSHIAVKSFDLVMALTAGGPGFASDLPATFMYSFAFTRNQLGLGAASAVMMLFILAAVLVPFIWAEGRERRRDR